MAESLIGDLGIERGSLVAVVGAGGKTTVCLRLVDDAIVRGWKAVFTTTTRIGVDQHGGHAVAAAAEAAKTVERNGVCVVGTPSGTEKLAGPGVDWIEGARDLFDLTVVEADGARGMRAKAPMPHEPVIPPSADLVVSVIAADALDRVIEDACHRPLRVASVVGAGPYDRLTPERAARLLTSADGGRKNVPRRYAVVINKVDEFESERVARLVELLGEVRVVMMPYEDRR